jgi:hypothetical protein
MTLPAVLAVISNDWRIGTPDERSVDKILEKRATAILRIIAPKIGSLKIIASI